MKIYIAGPMTGYENFNRAAFHKKAEALNEQGHYVLNPATLPDGLSQPEYMDICFAMIRAADAIHFLPGWEKSEGAVAEYHYGKKIGLQLLCAETQLSLVA
ncbi:nucleoside 2-deoxyribosyltransferase [Vibrio sp. HA2012]|uniref:DUF4406 domain-containing protein n=1 Tax=Vibrio sp. HA2012 TaxID=1971595 RepID=UPI000C2C1C01|nr:DUF4406 domain-containing protein [Vibrio sp. HA2012]PJC87815.1 nucleoside 2-deoxyribosyltransferase [Vibrio sp. HA2012]